MAVTNPNAKFYDDCAHIKRVIPDKSVDEKKAKEIGSNYRTLPAFEKTLSDLVYRKHYSLETNELLKCRWEKYKHHIEDRVFAPFQFPDVRHLHFHNNRIVFKPELFTHRTREPRMKLKPGPGVDFQGQMPIPQELIMKRGTAVKVNRKDKKKEKHDLKKDAKKIKDSK